MYVYVCARVCVCLFPFNIQGWTSFRQWTRHLLRHPLWPTPHCKYRRPTLPIWHYVLCPWIRSMVLQKVCIRLATYAWSSAVWELHRLGKYMQVSAEGLRGGCWAKTSYKIVIIWNHLSSYSSSEQTKKWFDFDCIGLRLWFCCTCPLHVIVSSVRE